MSRKTKHMVKKWKKKIAQVGNEYECRIRGDYQNQWADVGRSIAMFDYCFETGRLGTLSGTDQDINENENNLKMVLN